jgi:hypothetical protein
MIVTSKPSVRASKTVANAHGGSPNKADPPDGIRRAVPHASGFKRGLPPVIRDVIRLRQMSGNRQWQPLLTTTKDSAASSTTQ